MFDGCFYDSGCEPALNNDPVEILCNILKLIEKSENQWDHGRRLYGRHFLKKRIYFNDLSLISVGSSLDAFHMQAY